MVGQPFPSATPCSVYNGVNVEVVLSRPFRYIATGSVEFTQKSNLIFGQLNFSVFLASICRTMLYSIHRIFRSSSPIQMPRIYTQPISAIVCCITQIRRALSVKLSTDFPMYAYSDTVDTHHSIPFGVLGKRPGDAVIGEGFKSLSDKCSCFSSLCASIVGHFGFDDTHYLNSRQ